MSRLKAPKMAFVLNTNRTPSFKLCTIGSPIFGFKIGLREIPNNNINDKIINPNTMHSDQWTPIQLIVKPAKAGPNTDAICQVELFHVAAFG